MYDETPRLAMLKTDLGYQQLSDDLAGYLTSLLAFAEKEITRKGVALSTDAVEDDMLVSMYAAWLYRKRATASPMPEMLRRSLNDRIASRKMQVTDG